MQIAISDVIAAVGAVFAFLAWWHPRRPAPAPFPLYRADLNSKLQAEFAKFISKNDRRIVRLFVRIPLEESDIVNETHDEAGLTVASLTLLHSPSEGSSHGGMEVGLRGTALNSGAPLLFANGGHHLDGFFLVECHPGIWHGFSSATLTEVSADQIVLRN